MTTKPYTLQQLSQAILDTASAGLETAMNTYIMPSALGELPALAVEPMVANFTEAMNRGTDVWEFCLYVLVSANDFPTAVEQLSNFCTGDGPNSVRRALFDNPNIDLGKNVVAVVHGLHGYGGKFPWYGAAHVGAELLVRVYVS